MLRIPPPTSWRIRGMAVVEDMRGTGVGSNILQALIDHASIYPLPAEIWLPRTCKRPGLLRAIRLCAVRRRH